MIFQFKIFKKLEVSLARIWKAIDGELWNVNLGLMQRVTQKVHLHKSSNIEFSEMPNLEVSVELWQPNIDYFTWWVPGFIYFILYTLLGFETYQVLKTYEKGTYLLIWSFKTFQSFLLSLHLNLLKFHIDQKLRRSRTEEGTVVHRCKPAAACRRKKKRQSNQFPDFLHDDQGGRRWSQSIYNQKARDPWGLELLLAALWTLRACYTLFRLCAFGLCDLRDGDCHQVFIFVFFSFCILDFCVSVIFLPSAFFHFCKNNIPKEEKTNKCKFRGHRSFVTEGSSRGGQEYSRMSRKQSIDRFPWFGTISPKD